jgi:flagellar FliL protein
MAAENTGSEEKSKTALSSPAQSGGGGMMGTLISGINLLVSCGMVGVLFMSYQREKQKTSIEDISAHGEGEKDESKGHGEGHGEGEKHEESVKKSAIDFGKMVTLEQFTVNLSTPGSVNPKFARVNISLEVPTDITENEVNVEMPQVRNTIIDLFNSKRPSDLATVDGREYLKDEIKNAINSFLVSGKVKGVFFTSFAVSG